MSQSEEIIESEKDEGMETHYNYETQPNMDELETVMSPPTTNEGVMELMNEPVYEDYKHLFLKGLEFKSSEEAKDWVYVTGYANKMYFKVTTSKDKLVYLGCERGGIYEDPKVANPEERISKRLRKSKGTKKIDCKFQVRLLQQWDGKWFVRMGEHKGRHNQYGNWHRSYVKLQETQMDKIALFSGANVKPKNILDMLLPENPGLNLRQINNAKVKLKKIKANGLNSIELLFKKLSDKGYYYWPRNDPGSSLQNKMVGCYGILVVMFN